MADIKLAKNSKIKKLPQQSWTVRSTLERAVLEARDRKWTKVVVIGSGPKENRYFHSRMTAWSAIGMLEDMKYGLMRDRW